MDDGQVVDGRRRSAAICRTLPGMNLTDAIYQHLDAHGPCTVDDLYAAMRELGVTKAKTSASVLDALRRSATAAERLPDGGWDVVTRGLVGATVTVRPRSRLADGVLWTHADLTPFEAMLRTELPLRDGGTARWSRDDVTRLVFPPGTLPEIGPGQLLALRWDGVVLSVSVVDEPTADPDYVARIDRARRLLALHATTRDPWTGQARGRDIRGHVLSALREDPDLLREPLPPLSELVPLPDVDLESPSWSARGRRLELALPDRIVNELDRRAGLLGDSTPSYAAMLLTSAVDRVRPLEAVALAPCCPCGDPHCSFGALESDTDDDDWPYVDPADDDVEDWEQSLSGRLSLVRRTRGF